MAYNFTEVTVEQKPLIPETLKKIPRGKSCRFSCVELGKLPSVQAAIYRLNKKGFNFTLNEVINNGESYIITNN